MNNLPSFWSFWHEFSPIFKHSTTLSCVFPSDFCVIFLPSQCCCLHTFPSINKWFAFLSIKEIFLEHPQCHSEEYLCFPCATSTFTFDLTFSLSLSHFARWALLRGSGMKNWMVEEEGKLKNFPFCVVWQWKFCTTFVCHSCLLFARSSWEDAYSQKTVCEAVKVALFTELAPLFVAICQAQNFDFSSRKLRKAFPHGKHSQFSRFFL